MSTLIDLIKKCKAPILWTIGYVCILWLVYQFLFNFDIFNARHWIHVSHVHFRGLGGFAFCTLTFAAIPLYIGTLAVVIRNQKPLLSIPTPKFITDIFSKSKSTTTEPEKIEETESAPITPTNEEIDKFPAEMRGAFIHARTHPNRITAPICSACSVNPNVYPDTTPTTPDNMDDNLPLPPDFDTMDNDTQPISAPSSAPVFQDINLYGDTEPDITPETQNSVTEHLTKTNRKFTVLPNDIILTNDAVIAVHDDNDFWIMDEPIWFASGKTRTSPIDALCDTAKQNKVTPILYLGATNIMQLDEKCAEWKSRGIRIIKNLTDL